MADGSAAAAVVDVESREVELWEQVRYHGIDFPPLCQWRRFHFAHPNARMLYGSRSVVYLQ